MPHAFVTGATGFIGQHVCQQLLQQDWQVTILRRKSSALGVLTDQPIEHKIGDVADVESVRQAIDRPYDALFHIAANTSVWRRHRDVQSKINIDGTHNVIEAAQAAGVGKLIHTSTVSVYGFPPEHVISEATPRDTGAYWINYFRSKAAAEDLVLAASSNGLDAVIVSPAHVMGPLDRHNWARMIAMVANNSLPGIPPGAGSFADARQIARAQINAVKSGRSGEKYLLGGENHRFADVVAMISDILDQPTNSRVMPALVLKIVAQLKTIGSLFTGKEPDITPESAAIVSGHEQVDSSKAIAELDYQITPTRQLLQDSIEWLRSEGLIS